MLNVIKLSAVILAMITVPFVAADETDIATSGMEKVKVKRLDEVFAKPNVDWTKYSAVSISPLDMSTTKIKAPSGTYKRDIPAITEETSAPFKESYLKAFTQEFSEDGLLAEDNIDKAATLPIEARLLQIAPTHIPNSRTNASGRNRVYSETAGKLEMQFDIFDGATGEHLASVKDRREATKMWRENNRVHNRTQLNQIMGTWARIFRTHLDDIGEK